jgi:hypothetical protein
MTTSNLMSLPVDIPWERLGTARDMIDEKFGDSNYPPKWRSSVSIFYYEPPTEAQQITDRTITYLKVSCTVTGYQGTSKFSETSIPPEWLSKSTWPTQTYANIRNRVRYHPCHGMLLQVGVYPMPEADREFDLTEYPFILDFEPKKREMYESATEAKQHMSHSRSNISAKKGTKTVESSETTVSLDAGTDAIGGSVSHKMGTSTETVDMTTADHSRERRENYSYSTNISHMYHLLNGYHLGTNRAMFMMQPRPHIIDSEFTFLNGPRRLEGIQEFFLIVERPRDVAGLCIETTLETAHLETVAKWMPRVVGRSELWDNNNVTKTAEALQLLAWERDLELETAIYGNKIWNSQPKWPSGWIPYAVDLPYNETARHVRARIKTYWETDPGGNFWTESASSAVATVLGRNPEINLVEDADVIYERNFVHTGNLFLTGRTIKSCTFRPLITTEGIRDSLTYEKKLTVPASLNANQASNSERATAANRMGELVAHEMMESLESPDRLPYGAVSVDEARFIQEPLQRLLAEMPDDDPYNMPLSKIHGIDPDVRGRLEEMLPGARRKDVMTMKPSELGRALELTETEVRRLFNQLIGEGPRLEIRPSMVVVPSVVGKTHGRARRMLIQAGIAVGEAEVYAPSMELRDTVINQYPNAGDVVDRKTVAFLVLASGPVAVPDVVGLNVDEATARLEELSLRVEMSFAVSDEQPEGHVLETTPSANTEVPRNSQLVLLVARKA